MIKITILFIVVIQLILGFQGFDVCDDGFALTFYQQFFNDPDAVEYNFVYWLSGLVGGVWYELYEKGGVLWFRLLGILVNTSTFLVSYQLLKPWIRPVVLIPSLLIVLFINDFGFLIFYNNHLTALLSVLSAGFLLKGLKETKMAWILFSGLIIGLNVFSRLPNLSQLAMVLVIPYWFYLNKQNISSSFKSVGWFFGGITLGFGLVFILLMSLNQLEIMERAFLSLFEIGKADKSSHNVMDLFQEYLKNYKLVFINLVLILGIFFSFQVLATRFKFNRTLLIVKYLMFLLLLLLWSRNSKIFGLYGLSYIGIGVVLIWGKSREIKALALMGLVMQFLLPFGSGGGMRSIGYMSLWLSFPWCFYALDVMSAKNQNGGENSFFLHINKNAQRLLLLFTISFLGLKSYQMFHNAYFDQGSRFDKRYTVNSKFAKNVFTTEQRATIINQALAALESYVGPNDYLLAYDKIPMFHFLTQTRPYMYNSWPWIYDAKTFTKKLRTAEQERPVLPVVLVQKFETIGSFSEPQSNYLSESSVENYFHNNEIAKEMKDFLLRNNYRLVWTNPYFNIYKVP